MNILRLIQLFPFLFAILLWGCHQSSSDRPVEYSDPAVNAAAEQSRIHIDSMRLVASWALADFKAHPADSTNIAKRYKPSFNKHFKALNLQVALATDTTRVSRSDHSKFLEEVGKSLGPLQETFRELRQNKLDLLEH